MPSRPDPNWTVEGLTYDNLQADPGLDFLFLEGGTVDVSSIDFTSANEPIPIDETYWYFSARASYWFRWSDDDENFFDLDSEEDLNFILEQTNLFSMRPRDSRLMPELPDDGITIIPTNPDDAASDFYIFGFFPVGDSSLLRSLGDEQIEITTWDPLTDETVLPQFFADGVDLAYGQSWDNLDQWTENVLSEIAEYSIPEAPISQTSVPEGSMGFGLLAVGVILFGGICKRKLAKMFG